MGFLDIFKRRQDASTIFDFDLFETTANGAYIKEIALDTVLNFVARSIAQSDFRVYNGTKIMHDDIAYKLNVRPNVNQSSTTFWRDLIYRLMRNNEVLVVKSDTGDLLIADTWTTNNVALVPVTFSNVSVSGLGSTSYNFTRTFSMNDVWYITYTNEKLTKYINELGNELGKLYERMLEIQMRNGQIRGTVSVGATAGTDEQKMKNLQLFIDKIYSSFKSNSVAIVPQTAGFDYTELTNTEGVQKQTTNDLRSTQDQMTDTVAALVGVPPSLIHGQNEKLESNIKSFLDFCLNPLIKMVQDELNAKLFTAADFISGNRVEIVGLNKRDIYSAAESIDKLVSAGVANPNEIREDFGLEPRTGGDEYVLTKNYLKGGENNETTSQGNNRIEQ
ncbi:phage portal protein [Lacticaseibacillus saniviri]